MGLFNQLSNPSAPVERNAFDRSERVVFSSSVGTIQPVGCFETMPNAEYDIDIQQILRSDPIIGAPFTRLKMNYEFAYVDYSSIWSQFGDFVAQREDLQLSNQGQHSQIPYFDSLEFITNLVYGAFFDYYVNIYVRDYYLSGDGEYLKAQSIVNYHAPWDGFFLGALKNYDLLGYGNLLPVLKAIVSKMEWHMKQGQGDSFFDAVTIDNVASWQTNKEHASRLLISDGSVSALVGIIDEVLIEYVGVYRSDTQGVKLNAWRIAAYNRYWYDFKRNDIYDTEMHIGVHSLFDSYVAKVVEMAPSINIEGLTTFLSDIYDNNGIFRYVDLFNYDRKDDNPRLSFTDIVLGLSMKYVQYKKDKFTAVMPSTQFGDVAMMSETDVWHNLISRDSDGDFTAVSAVNSGDYFHGLLQDGNESGARTFKFDPAVAISVIEQRSANALQRFRERMMRAGNKTKKNYKAHWGVEPSRILDTSSIFLGAYDGALEMNMTPATSNSENTQIGELGANGVGFVQGSRVHFKSNDFGVIMCMFFMEKPAEYDGFGVNRFNQLLDVWDLPYPEFMNVSLAPVDVLDLTLYKLYDGQGKSRDRVLGYLPRFIEHKTSVDRVTGEFYSSDPTAGYNFTGDQSIVYGHPDVPVGVFSQMVTPRYGYGSAFDVNFLYVNPASVDNIFTKAWSPLQADDHFFINCNFDVKVVLPLSVVGLPV